MTTPFRVLSVASECAPLIKTGGLADVVGALPAALAAEGIEVTTLLPAYKAVKAKIEGAEPVLDILDCFGGEAQLLKATYGGLDLLLLEAPHLYDRGAGIYLDAQGHDWHDNAERFGALSRVASEIANGALADYAPDLVHCHDWQAGLVPYYIARSEAAARIPTVMTIHNIAFQGLVHPHRMGRLGIDGADFHPEGVEYYGQLSTLKAGLRFAWKLTTVSPTYAEELMRPEFGMGMDGLLRSRRADLLGILNGVDEDAWNPATDPHIQTYKAARGKAKNKKLLRERFGLPDAPGPLCVVITRMTEQKGLDLLLEALPALTASGGQLALLGSGDSALENAFRDFARGDPNVSVEIGYDETLSHQMLAGGDAILVPSRFEPCGLTQLMGLRYGTLPIVALTGGLADTVIGASPATMARGVATGFQFFPVTAQALEGALVEACAAYSDKPTWSKMQRNAMGHPVGWDASARAYGDLYRSLASAP
ncbi:MAG: glycogen synthase GlgA [Pseudomonadota bacterium]